MNTKRVQQVQNDLIMDIGMHRGEDAEFYLRKGFRVVAVEADPELVADAAARLTSFVAAGRLEICNAAIADYEGQIDFYASGREGWGCVSRENAATQALLSVPSRTMTVPCTTFDFLLGRYGTPYFLKIDIEGSDLLCLSALEGLAEKPKYVSIECHPVSSQAAFEMLARLWGLGYRQFKVVNQALNPWVQCPSPAREGKYVDARFSKLMSGPFGEEAPGAWQSAERAYERLAAIGRSQQLRAAYAATGKLYGIPIGRFHRTLHWTYNAPIVRAARFAYSRLRGTEIGGWFDIHARHGAYDAN